MDFLKILAVLAVYAGIFGGLLAIAARMKPQG